MHSEDNAFTTNCLEAQQLSEISREIDNLFIEIKRVSMKSAENSKEIDELFQHIDTVFAQTEYIRHCLRCINDEIRKHSEQFTENYLEIKKNL